LEGYEIGISGAVPERNKWSEPAMDRAILEFVALLSGLVFKYGGRIVHGSQPSLMPVILRQARLHAGSRGRRPVTLVVSDLWARDWRKDDFGSIEDVAELIVTPAVGNKGPEDAETRNASLSVMRRALTAAQNTMIAVGGKLHEKDGFVAGVGEEMHLAAAKGIPRFLVGGLGGYAKGLAHKLAPSGLNNYLSREANVRLFGTSDVGACVNVIFEHLASSGRLRRAATRIAEEHGK
jgi:hypothetical protein